MTSNPSEIRVFEDIVCWIKLSDVPALKTLKLSARDAVPLVSRDLFHAAMTIGASLEGHARSSPVEAGPHR